MNNWRYLDCMGFVRRDYVNDGIRSRTTETNKDALVYVDSFLIIYLSLKAPFLNSLNIIRVLH